MKKKLTEKQDKGLYLSKENASAIEKTEEVGTAAMRTGVQMLLAIEEILADDYNFSEGEIKKIETKFKWMMRTLYNLKRDSLTIMSPEDMKIVGKIAERWQMEDHAQKTGFVLPDDLKQKLIKH